MILFEIKKSSDFYWMKIVLWILNPWVAFKRSTLYNLIKEPLVKKSLNYSMP